jgi:hypothetical protein
MFLINLDNSMARVAVSIRVSGRLVSIFDVGSFVVVDLLTPIKSIIDFARLLPR